MAFVSSFTYCDTIQTQITPTGPQYQIVNPLQALVPIAIPSNYSFSIACNISDFDQKVDHEVEILFMDPNNEIVSNLGKFNFNVANVPANGTQALQGIQINVDMRNVELRSEGIYITKIVFDQVCIGEYKIRVIKRG